MQKLYLRRTGRKLAERVELIRSTFWAISANHFLEASFKRNPQSNCPTEHNLTALTNPREYPIWRWWHPKMTWVCLKLRTANRCTDRFTSVCKVFSGGYALSLALDNAKMFFSYSLMRIRVRKDHGQPKAFPTKWWLPNALFWITQLLSREVTKIKEVTF